ncbi:unnamed protein product [marine sediment metagenome]|uniref:Uncharacterized protein n=1 Tax=marine sediment metagenome TaxID=412755 RepID=X0V7X2_9ZZZZ
MPYIIDENDRRQQLKTGSIAENAGELNFKIFSYVKDCLARNLNPNSKIIKVYVDQFLGSTPNYQRYNDMTGCLIRCQKEIQRRLGQQAKILFRIMESYDFEISEYEDKKIEENGDV